MDDVANRIRDAVEALVGGDLEASRFALSSVDRARLIEERTIASKAIWGAGGVASQAKAHQPNMRRDSVNSKRALALFQRDHFTCRYRHCQRKTVYLPVFKALSNAFPDLQPYHSNWKPLASHILLWTYASSVEHHLAFAHGGTSADDNLITACYQCNDLKNRLTVEDLGWEIAEPQPSTWDGLASQVPALKAAGYLWTAV